MKTIFNKIYLTIAFIALATFVACNDFMDIEPTDQYKEEVVFSDAGLTQAFLNTMYYYLTDGAKEHNTTGLTDDAYFTHNYGQIAVNTTAVSESSLEWYDNGNNPFKWQDCYKGIYYANLFLKNIDNVPEKVGFDNSAMKGEAYFCRAWLYTQLMRGFGAIPIVTEVYGLIEQEKMSIARSNIADVYNFIISDLDEAIKLLPGIQTGNNLGRASKYAAQALKARVSLHVASPLYADKAINTLEVNQFTGSRDAAYQIALDFAESVINCGQYTLVNCSGGTALEVGAKYQKVAITNNTEMIFTKQFTTSATGPRNNLPVQHGPNGYSNWSGTTPTQDFVVHFEMEDGSLSGSTGLSKPGEYVQGNPYNHREPRFYANLGYDGATWGRPRTAGKPYDPTPLGTLQCGTYEVNDGNEVSVNLPDGSKLSFNGLYGVDTRQGPIEDWNGSWTGYYERKLIDTSVDGQNFPQTSPWPHIRLAEMYLIAAEAAIELNKLDVAETYLNTLRARIDRPDVRTTLTARGKTFVQEDMREFLRQERRSELSFEDSRYYDVRRWMILNQTSSKTLTGITVIGRLKQGQTATKPYIHNEDTWDYHYYVRDLSAREERKYDQKMYFAPIKREELKRNNKLVQNPGQDK